MCWSLCHFVLANNCEKLFQHWKFQQKSFGKTSPGMKMIYHSISIRFQTDGPLDLVCIFKMTRIKLQKAKLAQSLTLPHSNCCHLLLEMSTRIRWLSLRFLSGVTDDGQIDGQGRSGNRPARPFLLSLLLHFSRNLKSTRKPRQSPFLSRNIGIKLIRLEQRRTVRVSLWPVPSIIVGTPYSWSQI